MAQLWTASMFLIKISSSLRFLIERAMAMETARGRPSGTATIKSTTATIRVSPSLVRVVCEKRPSSEPDAKVLMTIKMTRVMITNMAASFANLLIYSAATSSLPSKKVFCSSISRSFGFLVLAKRVFSPTQHTRALPHPVMTLLSEKSTGSG